MDQTHVGSEAQETETGPPATQNRGSALVLETVESRSLISSPTFDSMRAVTKAIPVAWKPNDYRGTTSLIRSG